MALGSQEEAQRDLRNMQVELQGILQRERAKHGLLVKQALYGHLQLKEELLHQALQRDRRIEADDLAGPFIDVTWAVQGLVEQHSIVVHGSSSSSKASKRHLGHVSMSVGRPAGLLQPHTTAPRCDLPSRTAVRLLV